MSRFPVVALLATLTAACQGEDVPPGPVYTTLHSERVGGHEVTFYRRYADNQIFVRGANGLYYPCAGTSADAESCKNAIARANRQGGGGHDDGGHR
ncbi:hypothetical protein [Tropicibacter sp. S64]|uniref:hypothetical protein n=1 Tax=Tropicibacter sp. S64 TaxID=3415122 RepID=UPI003C7C9946